MKEEGVRKHAGGTSQEARKRKKTGGTQEEEVKRDARGRSQEARRRKKSSRPALAPTITMESVAN